MVAEPEPPRMEEETAGEEARKAAAIPAA